MNPISLRQATYADSEFAYKVKKAALGKYVEKTYGEWNEEFQVSCLKPKTS